MSQHEIILGLVFLLVLAMLLAIRLADYARGQREAYELMRRSRDGWRDHHRKLVGESDDGTDFWKYWREEAGKDR